MNGSYLRLIILSKVHAMYVVCDLCCINEMCDDSVIIEFCTVVCY